MKLTFDVAGLICVLISFWTFTFGSLLINERIFKMSYDYDEDENNVVESFKNWYAISFIMIGIFSLIGAALIFIDGIYKWNLIFAEDVVVVVILSVVVRIITGRKYYKFK